MIDLHESMGPGRGSAVRHASVARHVIDCATRPGFLTNERHKTYQMGFSFGHLGHAPGMGVGGTKAAMGSKIIFFGNSSELCV